jgi:hypothetical protein
MRGEYDCSHAECGKFYRPDLRLIPRAPGAKCWIFRRPAQKRGTTVNQWVNQLLKKDIELIRAAAG